MSLWVGLLALLVVAGLLKVGTRFLEVHAPVSRGLAVVLVRDLHLLLPLLLLPGVIIGAVGFSGSALSAAIAGSVLGLLLWLVSIPWSFSMFTSVSAAIAELTGMVISIAVLIAGWFSFHPGLDEQTRSGTTLLAAALLWITALLVMSSALWRTSVRAVALSATYLALANTMTWSGVIPGRYFDPRKVIAATLFTLGVTTLWPAVKEMLGIPVATHAVVAPDSFRVLAGAIITCTSLGFCVASLVLGHLLNDQVRVTIGQIPFHYESAEQVGATGDYAKYTDKELLFGFMPDPSSAELDPTLEHGDVLPTRATDYLADSKAVDIRASDRPEHQPAKPAQLGPCPDHERAPCFVLHHCSGCRSPSVSPTFPFYGLVFRRGQTSGENVDWGAADKYGLQGLQTLLQYWVFYDEDQWSSRLLGTARLEQTHDADWESVTIGLNNTKPLFVATSAHCGGWWQRWDRLQVVVTDPMPQENDQLNPDPPFNLHPGVIVAIGSHAFYPTAFKGSVPDWAGCSGAPVPSEAMSLISSAADIRENITARPIHLSPTVVDQRTTEAVMAYPAYWSPGDTYTLLPPHRARPFEWPPDPAKPGGPLTPTFQPLGHDPVGTIFASPHWHEYQ